MSVKNKRHKKVDCSRLIANIKDASTFVRNFKMILSKTEIIVGLKVFEDVVTLEQSRLVVPYCDKKISIFIASIMLASLVFL